MFSFWRRLTMIRTLFIIPVPLFWITGVSLSKEVYQSPSEMLLKPGDSDRLNCSHKIPNYDTILWYQRSVGDTALKLIANAYYKTPTVEPSYKDNSVTKIVEDRSITLVLLLYPTYQIMKDSMILVVTATVSLLCLSGGVVSLSVQQSPHQLSRRPGETMKITCSHHDRSYDKIYWYRQTDGQNLQIIGYLSFKESFDVDKKYKIYGDAEKEGFLELPGLGVEDTGFYYCAVSKAQ
ncbi:hypothetical protein DPEC_G00312950 [Dallia pectoralis]|uniref:Uncharacterized protein n=1 Tax=Dallia pectoralis TaxID=75939 RepID=A0ACC2FBU6_DALPE|nr:hypothetical protein DPEC_G00312950 [Dallia pectoralis]